MFDELQNTYLSHLNNAQSLEKNFIRPITNEMKDSYLNFENIYDNLKKTCNEAEDEYITLIDCQDKYYKITKVLSGREKELREKMMEFD